MCLYRQTSSPGLTSTHRRSAGRQGAPSPASGGDALTARTWPQSTTISAGWQEEVEHALKDEHKQSVSLTLNVGEVSGVGEIARGGGSLAKALGGRVHHHLQPVDVGL